MGLVAAFALGVALITVSLSASAHRTGNERRTQAACRLIPDVPDRQNCVACVNRPRPHHYHPRGDAPGYCHLNTAER